MLQVCVCVCAPTAPSVCALGWVKCREQNFTAGYTLYNYVCKKKKKSKPIFFFLQNRKPIMVKCLNIGKNIGKPIYRSISTFKSECENRTLMLLQIFVVLVLLELSELSSCAFSQSENYFSCVVPVMMLLTSVSEKQRTNISTDRSGMAPK